MSSKINDAISKSNKGKVVGVFEGCIVHVSLKMYWFKKQHFRIFHFVLFIRYIISNIRIALEGVYELQTTRMFRTISFL